MKDRIHTCWPGAPRAGQRVVHIGQDLSPGEQIALLAALGANGAVGLLDLRLVRNVLQNVFLDLSYGRNGQVKGLDE